MSPDSPPPAPRPPHPLTVALTARLRDRPGARVLEIGTGSGRNARALSASGISVIGIGQGVADAALSTHALLHGMPVEIERGLRDMADNLEPGGLLYATFGSELDQRFGKGQRYGPFTFAPHDGDEAGVRHTFFDEQRLRALLEPQWAIESMRETGVDEIAGSWAHQTTPLRGAIHWFVIARKR